MCVGIINVSSIYAKLIIISYSPGIYLLCGRITSSYKYFGAAAPNRRKDMGFSLQAILLANPKMSDKHQFVGAFGSRRVVETSDKLKFVEHI